MEERDKSESTTNLTLFLDPHREFHRHDSDLAIGTHLWALRFCSRLGVGCWLPAASAVYLCLL